MPYDREHHHRRSIRLGGFDYSRHGAYFITVCTQHRLPLFGDIRDGRMHPSAAGQMVESTWHDLPARLSVTLDAFILMPNHVHGIIWINPQPGQMPSDDTDGRGEPCVRPPSPLNPRGTADGSLPRIVQAFKSLSTNVYIKGVKEYGWRGFDGHLWQRNYFEHVIRDDESLSAIREYINTNPARWETDIENAAGSGTDDLENWLHDMIASKRCDAPRKKGEHEVRPYTGRADA